MRILKSMRAASLTLFLALAMSSTLVLAEDRCNGALSDKDAAEAARQTQKQADKFVSDLLKTFIRVSRRDSATPSASAMAGELGITEKDLGDHIGRGKTFESWDALKRQAYEMRPNAFRRIQDSDLTSPAYRERVIQALRDHQRFIITTAVAGAPVNREFLASLQTYARERDAIILVRPADGSAVGLDPALIDSERVLIVNETIELDPWLAINAIPIPVASAEPLNGLRRQAVPKGQKQIIAATVVRRRTYPTLHNNEHPHTLYTTGAITEPRYANTKSGWLARDAHRLTALVVEKTLGNPEAHLGITAKGSFHIRRVRYVRKAQGFQDIDQFYSPGGVRKAKGLGISGGDTHVGETSPSVSLEKRKLILDLDVNVVVEEDALDGKSIAYWDRVNTIIQARKYVEGSLSLDQETRKFVSYLNAEFSLKSNLIIILKIANHHERPMNWLKDGNFMSDPINAHIGAELAHHVLNEGKDFFEYLITTRGLDPTKRKRLVFAHRTMALGRDGEPDSLAIVGIHGHEGENGSKGNFVSLAMGIGNLVAGHTHVPQEHDDSVNVGTGTKLDLDYLKGLSSWGQGLALIGENSEKQLLTFHDDEWYRDLNDKRILTADEVFMPGFPRIKTY